VRSLHQARADEPSSPAAEPPTDLTGCLVYLNVAPAFEADRILCLPRREAAHGSTEWTSPKRSGEQVANDRVWEVVEMLG